MTQHDQSVGGKKNENFDVEETLRSDRPSSVDEFDQILQRIQADPTMCSRKILPRNRTWISQQYQIS